MSDSAGRRSLGQDLTGSGALGSSVFTSAVSRLTSMIHRCNLLPPVMVVAGLLLMFSSCMVQAVSADEYARTQIPIWYSAIVNITYKDPVTGEMRTEREEIGRYGTSSRMDTEWGWVVHIRTTDNKSHGCTPPVNVPRERWIALIQRGACKFTTKIYNAAVEKNASAVVIYNHKHEPDLLTMDHNVADVVSIFISKPHGEHIAALVDNGTHVLMQVSVGQQYTNHYSNINKTSVLFVSISFIVLMIISLAWLVFYYIQRFRYAHAKERLSKRLMHAAKKAITKMPVRTIKNGDRETDSDFDQCAVCIESYKVSDVIRLLPCKHIFHRSCVDPWLIEQRSCPMCKLDILKAYGLQIHGSHESVVNMDLEGPSTSLGPSELIPPESSREIDSDGVEVIRFQPAQIEYHDAPSKRLALSRGAGAKGAAAAAAPSSAAAATADAASHADAKKEEDDDDGAGSAALAAAVGEDCVLPPSAVDGMLASGRTVSMESVHSVDSDTNELQLLMRPDSSPVKVQGLGGLQSGSNS